jgi:hypothetical protein
MKKVIFSTIIVVFLVSYFLISNFLAAISVTSAYAGVLGIMRTSNIRQKQQTEA